jgi:hypothetical protein
VNQPIWPTFQLRVLTMSIRYYDPTFGRERFKRRYLWAATGFMLGLFAGVVLPYLGRILLQ